MTSETLMASFASTYECGLNYSDVRCSAKYSKGGNLQIRTI